MGAAFVLPLAFAHGAVSARSHGRWGMIAAGVLVAAVYALILVRLAGGGDEALARAARAVRHDRSAVARQRDDATPALALRRRARRRRRAHRAAAHEGRRRGRACSRSRACWRRGVARAASPSSSTIALDVALAAGADGVHLGQDDLPLAAARRSRRAGFVIGVSTHDEAQARAAVDGGADYIGFGPCFPTRDKRTPIRSSASSGSRAVCRWRAPVVAIGGITLDTVADVRAPAPPPPPIIRAVNGAADITAAARAVAAAFAAAISRSSGDYVAGDHPAQHRVDARQLSRQRRRAAPAAPPRTAAPPRRSSSPRWRCRAPTGSAAAAPRATRAPRPPRSRATTASVARDSRSASSPGRSAHRRAIVDRQLRDRLGHAVHLETLEREPSATSSGSRANDRTMTIPVHPDCT